MKLLKIKPANSIRGKISLPGDKSICHRAVILSCLSQGKTLIKNFSFSQDCIITTKAFIQMGIKIKMHKMQSGICRLVVYGKGLYGLKNSRKHLYMGESGTSMRLIAGVLSGQRFNSHISAAKSLSRRPMKRITEPLRLMGADIKSKRSKREEYPPMIIRGRGLTAIKYQLPIPSAQVKSAVLLAGLYAEGKTHILQPVESRDHTERMLKLFGAKINIRELRLSIEHSRLHSPGVIEIPGDISSASFFIVGACILEGSQIAIKSVGLNATRTGLLKVLKRMGADIKIQKKKLKIKNSEPVGDIIAKSSKLKGVNVKSGEIPSLIDELPVLMVAACFAKGKTIIDGIQELRVKETDRVNSMVTNLKRMGADIKIKSQKIPVRQAGKGRIREQIVIKGVNFLRGARLDSFGDHRTAMSLIIASLRASGGSILCGMESIKKSFPGFQNALFGVIVRKKF